MKQYLHIHVEKVVVLRQPDQTDKIYIDLDAPSPIPHAKATLMMECSQGSGQWYCENILGIDVNEIISQ